MDQDNEKTAEDVSKEAPAQENFPSETFENDHVKVTAIEKPHCFVELQVHVSPSTVVATKTKAIKSIAKGVSIPGFRKGKAPEKIILQHYEKDVDEKWKRFVAEDAFKESGQLSKKAPLSQESRVTFDVKDFSAESGADLIFGFETEPTIPEVDFTKLTLSEEPREVVDDSKVDETIHRIRLFFSTWREVKDRPVQDGDFIIVDVDVVDTDPPQKAFSNARLEVGSASMAQWTKETVIGMNAGDIKEAVSRPDNDASDEEKKVFTEKKVKVHLKSIEEPVLPPVDDELAKKVGVQTADEMKSRLKTLLENQEEERLKKIYRDKISDALIDHTPFDIPNTVLHNEYQFRLQKQLETPSFKAFYEKLSDEEKKVEQDKIQTQSEKAVKLFYISRELIQRHQIHIDPDEVAKQVKTPLDAMFADRELINPNKTEEQKAMVLSRMMLTKAQDFVVDKVLHSSKE